MQRIYLKYKLCVRMQRSVSKHLVRKMQMSVNSVSVRPLAEMILNVMMIWLYEAFRLIDAVCIARLV